MNQAVLPRRRVRWRDHITGLLFAAPFIVGFLAFTLYPFLASLYYSFTDFGLLGQPQWVGLQNYTSLLRDEVFHIALSNNAYLVFVGMPFYIIWSLLVALLLNVNVRGQPLFRTIFLLPAIMPSVAASYVWLWVLNPRTGVGYFLSLVGITPPLWYNDPAWAKPGLILFWFWAVGLDALILLAALQGIPQDLKEAAQLDGASPRRRAWSIDLPLISPAILFITVTGVIWTVGYFTQAFIIAGTTGGRESSMLFLALYLYVNAFQYLKMGYASALAWVLFFINAGLTFAMLRITRERVFYG
ncbi:MAG: carbohydrate ABC transporter permease [Anaerolineae bacterium]